MRIKHGMALGLAVLLTANLLRAGNLDTIGVTILRQVDPTLTGSGVAVAQAEAFANSTNDFEVNPGAVGQPESLFTWISSAGTATNFPNSLGAASGHANNVAANFFGIPSGVATNVAHVDNYEAGYFYENIILPMIPTFSGKVVNQSFIFSESLAAVANQSYDNYAAQHGTLFVSGIGNGGPVAAPATCFNGIGVGVVDGSSSAGPTLDGRSKPDITAPGGATSYSTPFVSGAAAILLQAANRGDGGTNISAAADPRTLKALLLNGAVKPTDWTNTTSAPLDTRYGAGIVNVFNSWKQLGGGQRTFIEANSYSGSSHPPGLNTNNVPALAGWDFNSIASTPPFSNKRVHHYYFNLPVNSGGAFTLTSTLVWNRQSGQSAAKDLNLFLYDTATASLITCSTSAVDNVEHIFAPALPAGRYDLQVEKEPNLSGLADETYALAFEFFNLKLNCAVTNGNAVISWPLAPTGFRLESATSLNPPVSWTDITAMVAISNNQNIVTLPASAAARFFRLQRP